MNRIVSWLLLFTLVIICGQPSVSAFDFREQLNPVSLMRYDHHHIQKNKITGYTKIQRKTTIKKGKTFFWEIARNLEQNGKAFSEKQTLFDPETGDLISYSETDYRTKTSISNRIINHTIQTRVQAQAEQLEISLAVEKGIVPFEVLPHYLRKHLPKLQKEGRLSFTVYIPLMAIELKRKGMPISLSKIEMGAQIVETGTTGTILGDKQTIRIVLKPTSFLINAILPEERTSFYFTFTTEPPYTLLSFQENQTRSVLSELHP